MLQSLLLSVLLAQTPATPPPMRTTPVPEAYRLNGGVQASAFSPDGRYLAVGNARGKVVLWDWAARAPRAVLQEEGLRIGHPLNFLKRNPASLYNTQVWVSHLQFSPGGRYLAAPRTTWKHLPLALWEVPSGRRRDLQAPKARFGYGLGAWAFTPDERYFLATAAGGNPRRPAGDPKALPAVMVWETATGKLHPELVLRHQQGWNAFRPGAMALGFLPDARLLLYADDALRILDLFTGRTEVFPVELPGGEKGSPAGFHAYLEGRTLLLSALDGDWLAYWDLDDPGGPWTLRVGQAPSQASPRREGPSLNPLQIQVLPRRAGALLTVLMPNSSGAGSTSKTCWLDPEARALRDVPSPAPASLQAVFQAPGGRNLAWIRQDLTSSELCRWVPPQESVAARTLPAPCSYLGLTPEGRLLGTSHKAFFELEIVP